MKAGKRLTIDTEVLPPPKSRSSQSFSIPVSPVVRQYRAYGNLSRAKTPRTECDGSRSMRSAAAAEEPSIFITPQIESLITEWLQSLGFSSPTPRPQLQPMSDPFHNGVLACQLIQVLQKRPIEGITFSPSTTSEIARNFEKTLKAIQKYRPPAFNSAYYALSGKLAKGSEELLWGFYWAVFNAYPAAVPPHLEEVAKVLPYDSVEIRRLEEALLAWVKWLGVAQQYGNQSSLVELIPHIRTGYLLCHIVSQVFSYSITDVFAYPKSDSAAASNIRKALEVLKLHPNMSQKFVWGKEKEIMKGNMGVVMGLLEDICRCANNLPARRPGPGYHSDGPYCWSPLRPVGPPSFSSAQPTVPPPPHSDSPAPDIIPTPQYISSLLPTQAEEPSIDIDMPQSDATIKRWLRAIGIQRFEECYFGGSRINELRDGVLFCEIIESVERKKLPGVEYSPKTAAGCLQNMRRGLEFLRGKSAFPTELYYVEEDLRRGDGKVWRKVLLEMQRIYKFAGGSRKNRR